MSKHSATKSPDWERRESGHKPYVPDETIMPELTWPSVVVGAILGIVFGAIGYLFSYQIINFFSADARVAEAQASLKELAPIIKIQGDVATGKKQVDALRAAL